MSNNSKADDLAQVIIQVVIDKKPRTVEQLVAFVKDMMLVPEKEILNIIMNLQSQGKILLENQPLQPSIKLTTYMKTNHAVWYWETIAAAIVTAGMIFLVPENFYPLNYLRIALGAIFIFWLPGYTFVKALFPQNGGPGKPARNLDIIERIALSLGISLALVPLVGLMLNFTPWGIRLTPTVISLLGLTLVAATVALAREHKLQTATKIA